MSLPYRCDVLEKMVGKTIKAMSYDKDRIVLDFVDGERFNLNAEGDCCADCWIEHVDGAGAAGGVFIDLVEGGWDNVETHDCGNVLDSGFYTLKTSNGETQIDMRVSHNGYYGGTLCCEEVLA